MSMVGTQYDVYPYFIPDCSRAWAARHARKLVPPARSKIMTWIGGFLVPPSATSCCVPDIAAQQGVGTNDQELQRDCPTG